MRIDRIKLIAEMAKADMSCAELAEKAGVTRATVSAVRGGKSCNDETGVNLATALGVSVESLVVGGSGFNA